ncbi:MAG: P-loop NTPase [Acidimicrobiales bacterium]
MIEEQHDFSTFNFDDFSVDGGYAHAEQAVAEAAPELPALGSELPNGAVVAAVDADAAVRDYLASQFGSADVATAASLTELETRLGRGACVVLLGPSCSEPNDLALVEQWARTRPEVGTILVTSELTTALLHSAMRAGVKDVLSAPIDQMQLLETVSRVAEGLVASSPTPMAAGPGEIPLESLDGEVGKAIAVFSTKGGSGKSVVATNLAVALARRSDRPVVLIDGHLQFGDVGVMLKLQPQHTVIDATSQLSKLDAPMLSQLLTVHQPSGVMVLPAPHEPTFADQITGADMVQLIELVRTFAGHVVIDLPAIFNDVVLSVIEASDDVILVTGLDIPNIKNVKIGLSTLAMLNVPKEKLHLVLNRADSKVKLDVGEVEKTLQIHAAARIPSDVVVPISVNKGMPVVLSAPKSGVARAFELLAASFLDGSAMAADGSSNSKRRFFG